MSDVKRIQVAYADVLEADLDIINKHLMVMAETFHHNEGDSCKSVLTFNDGIEYCCAVKIENGQVEALVVSRGLVGDDDDAVMQEKPPDTLLH